MSDFRNIRIQSFYIPEIVDDKKTGNMILLEVISQETLEETVMYDNYTEHKKYIVFLCYEKMTGKPKKIHFINPDNFDEIILKDYRYENVEHGHRSSPDHSKNQPARNNSDT